MTHYAQVFYQHPNYFNLMFTFRHRKIKVVGFSKFSIFGITWKRYHFALWYGERCMHGDKAWSYWDKRAPRPRHLRSSDVIPKFSVSTVQKRAAPILGNSDISLRHLLMFWSKDYYLLLNHRRHRRSLINAHTPHQRL